jgi:hypothetical protein
MIDQNHVFSFLLRKERSIRLLFFIFGGEGPLSRRYGRTAALRLLVQPCDEDERKIIDFFIFPSNGAPVE